MDYETWIERHEQDIIEAYLDSIETLDDVPDNFIETYAEKHYEKVDADAAYERMKDNKMGF